MTCSGLAYSGLKASQPATVWVASALRVDQLGDAEIEQLGLAAGVDQDVAGLDVAVHHQVAVGEGDRRGDRHEKLEPARGSAARRRIR